VEKKEGKNKNKKKGFSIQTGNCHDQGRSQGRR
jgi:hypothetical protein